jgi:hypothetical protein
LVCLLAGLAFAMVHLGLEHADGGVRSHHLLNRPDLPAISNWIGLVTLPLLGWAVGLRARARGTARSVWVPLAGAMAYGAALAVSFELGAADATSTIFLGLFVLATVLPVHRVEYVAGFVTGMTITFGGALPLIVAAVVASLSLLVRGCVRALVAWRRSRRAPSVPV